MDFLKVYYSINVHMLVSEVDKPTKMLIKTSNAMEYIELDIQNTELPRINVPII